MTTPKYAMQDTKRPDGCYVTFERLTLQDDDADPNEYLFQDPDYHEQDTARLAAFHSGEWHFVGVRARALILVVRNGVGVNMSLESPGLWAIESDSDDDYLSEVYGEEVTHLKALIAALANPQYPAE